MFLKVIWIGNSDEAQCRKSSGYLDIQKCTYVRHIYPTQLELIINALTVSEILQHLDPHILQMAAWLAAFIYRRVNKWLPKKTWQNTHCFTEHHVAAWIYSKLRLLQNQDLSWQNKDLENSWMIWFGSSIMLFCDAEHQAKYTGLGIYYLPRILRGEKEFSWYHHFFSSPWTQQFT